MKYNLGTSFTVRDTLLDAEQVCSIIGDVIGRLTNQPSVHNPVMAVSENSARLIGYPRVQYQIARNGLSSVFKRMKHRRKYPFVTIYKTEGSSSRFVVAYPNMIGATISDDSVRVYVVDVKTRKFVNLGPTNGAIMELVHIFEYSHYSNASFKVSNCGNIRVDNNGEIPATITDLDQWSYRKMYADGIALNVILNGYKENTPNDVSYSAARARFGVSRPDPAVYDVVVARDRSWFDKHIPDLEIDCDRSDYPMDSDDLMFCFHAEFL